MELKMVFDATFIDEKQIDAAVDRINRDLQNLRELFRFEYHVDTYNVMDSELELRSGIPSVHLKVHIECITKQSRNYHNTAMIFQGYFGLLASCPVFSSFQTLLV